MGGFSEWRTMSDRARRFLLVWGGTALSAVALRPLWLWVGPRMGRCLFRALTGVPCPTCGSTRAVLAVLDLRLDAAFAANPMTALIFVLFLVGGVVGLAWAVLRLPLPRVELPRARTVVLVVVTVILANWAYLVVSTLR